VSDQLLSHQQLEATGPIMAHQQPSVQALLDGMEAVADRSQ